jgi:NADH:ubiquinone oxidoreductase subunit C
MFTSLKSFINSRLGRGVVKDDLLNEHGFFIKIDAAYLYAVASFLKNDPDVRLALLDQIICLPSGFLPWNEHAFDATHEIFYQFKSLKLPYKVTLAISVNPGETIQSISTLFLGARFFETDLWSSYEINIEERGEFKV